MARDLIVVGGSGFGRETFDIIAAVNSPRVRYHLLGVLDDGISEPNLDRLRARGIPYLGGLEQWLATGQETRFVVAIGNPGIRRRIAQRLEATGHLPATLIHPAATIGSHTYVGSGVVIAAGVQISTGVRIGNHCHLNPASVLGHDSSLADFVSINPGAVVSGECSILSGVLVGASATILQGLTVGSETVVGAAACVTKDVPSNKVVVGVPARWSDRR